MVERKEVEALLAACEMIREHELDPVNHSPIVPAPELAALCRAWLAVDEAPEADAFIASDHTHMWLEVFGLPADDMHASDSQRVRIVKEARET